MNDFLSKNFIKFVREGFVSKCPGNRCSMQAYMGAYATNINNIKSLGFKG